MEFQKSEGRIFAQDETGKLVAEITFPTTSENTYCINHTFVDPSLTGQGIAGQLVQMAVVQIRAQGGAVTATCSYAAKWLEKHPDY